MLTREEVIFEPPPVKFSVSFAKNGVKLNNTHAAMNNKNIINFNNNNNVTKVNEIEIANAAKYGGACVTYVCSKVTLYYNSRIELKWRRALHHCGTCDYGVGKGETTPCGAIHYGMCLPIVDRFSLPQKSSRRNQQMAVWPSALTSTLPGSGVKHGPLHSSHVNSSSDQSKSQQSSQPQSVKSSQTVSNGSSAKPDKVDSSSTILKDVTTFDRDPEKENTNISNIQINQSNQNIDTLATSNKESARVKKKDNSRPYSRNTVIQNANIPKFFFPMGRPAEKDSSDEVLLRVSQEFSKVEDGKIYRNQMGTIAKTCGLPLYWKCPLFMSCGGSKQGYITYSMFSTMWKRISQSCHDAASQFVTLVAKPGTNYMEEEDLVPLIQDVVDTHPGLTFLLDAPEFHSRYVNTVIARMLYCINRTWTGRITIQELRKSNFLRVLQVLEEEDDINQINDFFSYEHFYVIYCKFWELDKDHDLFIDKSDLARHNEHAISTRMLDRIFSGAVTRGNTFKDGKMSYPEFVWFLLSEEDKKHPTSIEYWFRCMDLDGDGQISMYEMEWFYEEQMQKMEALGIERLPFEDCLCQMLDLVQPEENYAISLRDLKRCKLTNIFFDTFMNLDKFLENEQRDPFANMRDLNSDVPEPTDWEKYAAEEYEILVAEEGLNEQEEIRDYWDT
ncbi:serine/threonine-protein phosphatase 2A regulatory subunit B'' subunit beta-like isoform X2 [Dreissena polymorpha]|uniref:serine/threonine-protein phosphatase 2A regulatory subunit B'' subunit beta-like isoform X2 n=1 Tax=Dreissena polymorpha TaxID=45954 RepID=UPI002264A633|nr:serine/threonine-protein phosphatase 2A regulatory subunit B'' subunit beta-like isoform X2 [Dreissena polymorpha]